MLQVEGYPPELDDWYALMDMLECNGEYEPFDDHLVQGYMERLEISGNIPVLDDLTIDMYEYVREKLHVFIYYENRDDAQFMKGWDDPESDEEDYTGTIVEGYEEDFYSFNCYGVDNAIARVLNSRRLAYMEYDHVNVGDKYGRTIAVNVHRKENAAQQVFFEFDFTHAEPIPIGGGSA